MCSGQGAVCGGSDDLKRRTQSVESPRRELRGASCELQEASQLLLGEAGHYSPEPLHHLWQQKINTSRHLHHSPAAEGREELTISITYFLSEVP